jgi:hypothetical protein
MLISHALILLCGFALSGILFRSCAYPAVGNAAYRGILLGRLY